MRTILWAAALLAAGVIVACNGTAATLPQPAATQATDAVTPTAATKVTPTAAAKAVRALTQAAKAATATSPAPTAVATAEATQAATKASTAKAAGAIPTKEITVQPTAAAPVECVLTPADQLGPYYIEGSPFRSRIAPEGSKGTPLVITGTVYLTGCNGGLGGAVLDVWQADAAGEYDLTDGFNYRGRVSADESGRFSFETVVPAPYNPRPAHIHVRVSHPDAETLVTQLYFEFGGAANPRLVLKLSDVEGKKAGTFDFVLKPAT